MDLQVKPACAIGLSHGTLAGLTDAAVPPLAQRIMLVNDAWCAGWSGW
jgi:hypothetical protein